MSAWRYEICLDTQNTTKIEDRLFAKNRVNKKLVFNVYNSNTDRPVNSAVDNNKSLSKTNSVERRSENYAFPSGVALRLQKNITIVHLNLISLKNKISCGMKCWWVWLEKVLRYVSYQKLKLMKLFRTNNLI